MAKRDDEQHPCVKEVSKLWRKSKVIAIMKPGIISSLLRSYIPISLLCHMYKLLERMILIVKYDAMEYDTMNMM